ncbi:AMP-binding protein, partial [Candidatus Bathyarchaeota archaeon]|nr:AMP-binding protein [Candidatus Bathyarchaeota archaeon]
SGNTIYFPVVFLGILMAGGIFTGANPGFTERELAYQLRDSGASFMFAAASTTETSLKAAKEVSMPMGNVFVFDTTIPGSSSPETPATGGARHWTEVLAPRAQAEKFDWAEPADARTTTCCLNYSSGTTGVPKGVEICHHSYVANGTGVSMLADMRDGYEELRQRSAALAFLPMYHAYGQTYFIANFAHQGIPVYVMPGFDLAKMLSHIERFRITHLTAVPPILVLLTKHPLAQKADLSSLELVGCGAAPLASDVLRETERLLSGKEVGKEVYVRQGWGMTEVTCTCLAWDGSITGTNTAVGEVMPNCQAKLMELDGKTEITTAKTPGELWVTGPTLLKGYWKKPEATAQTMVVDADGTRWLKTGDVAHVEEYRPGGLFHIVDRMKELIKVKGNQVAPAELEALLLERPDVADVAVVGVTVDGMEIPRAYVVLKEGAKADAGDIAGWLAERVARYKRLAGGVVFTDVIPKNPVRAVPSLDFVLCRFLT